MIKKIALPLLLAFIISLPTFMPLFRQEFFHMHDYTHVARTIEMHQSLKDGHTPPRWSQNLGFGYGLPQFSFYAPLPYYVTAFFYNLGISGVNTIKLLFILNSIISCVAMYKASRTLWESKIAGIVSAASFLYIPYRAVDSYVRGALGELTAITFVAITMWAILHWDKKKNWKSVSFIGLSITGIILSHNLVAFIALPFIALLLGTLSITGKHRILSAKQTTAGLLLGVGGSAYYAIPALLEKGYTMVDTLTTGFSNFQHHFLYLRQLIHDEWGYGGSIFGPDDDLSFEIGKIQILLVIMTLIGFLKYKQKILNQQKVWAIFLTLSTGFAILLTTFKTKWIWESISLMSYIQFPWRYLSVIIVFVSLLTGGIFAKRILFNFPHLKVIAASITVMVLIMLNSQFFKPVDYLDSNEALYYEDISRIQSEMSGVIPDFMPITTAELPLTPPIARYELEDPTAGVIQVELDEVHQYLLKVNITRPTSLVVNIAEFPGWSMYLDGQKVTPHIGTDIRTQSLSLDSTDRELVVSGLFEETMVRKTANALSIISIFSMSAMLIEVKTRKE